MRRVSTVLFCILLAPALGAQAPRDSGATRAHREGHERFQKERETRIREALGLTDDQAAKFHATLQRFATERRAASEQMRSVLQALRAQLRPGVAANADSVRKLLDAEEHSAGALVQLRHDERHDMATYLSPVQLGQLELMHRGRMGWRRRMRGWMWHRASPKDGGPGGTPDGDGPPPT